MSIPSRILFTTLLLLALALPAAARESLNIAAAADLKFVMNRIVESFRSKNPDAAINVTYGSSGNFYTQIKQGAPFDLYFSADIAFPRRLAAEGLASSTPELYARGRIVLWTRNDAGLDPQRGLELLLDPTVRTVAIANPEHAPYGARARECLISKGLWEKVQSKLVFGENIAQTAQFIQTGNAAIGIIALSLVKAPSLSEGQYLLLPESCHQPLDQGYIVTSRAAANPLAKKFAAFISSPGPRAIMETYGFVLPR